MRKIFTYREKIHSRSAKQLSDIVNINEAIIELRRITDKQQIGYSDFVPALKLL
ncbi:hypothetical protein K413DRAFT_4630 [Clostridium sp. ASBs410]|nr:hypothetical protein K413DRAFT_4630 [Clostridium sp. ASBs410]